jgi:hypothetical protein
MSKLMLISAPSKEDVAIITELIPSELKVDYTILVLAPGRQVESFAALRERLETLADLQVEKLKKMVGGYVS